MSQCSTILLTFVFPTIGCVLALLAIGSSLVAVLKVRRFKRLGVRCDLPAIICPRTRVAGAHMCQSDAGAHMCLFSEYCTLDTENVARCRSDFAGTEPNPVY